MSHPQARWLGNTLLRVSPELSLQAVWPLETCSHVHKTQIDIQKGFDSLSGKKIMRLSVKIGIEKSRSPLQD